MDKLTYEYYRSELDAAFDHEEAWELTLGRLLEIIKGAWTDGHITGYQEGKAAGETAWY